MTDTQEYTCSVVRRRTTALGLIAAFLCISATAPSLCCATNYTAHTHMKGCWSFESGNLLTDTCALRT